MPSTVLVGAQWGDEGKGKITDLIAREYDFVVRYQGGNNAGHTVIHGDKKLALHLMPSGVMYDHAVPVIGNGVVVDPGVLIKEMAMLEAEGISCKNLKISCDAHVIMPYHKDFDGADEKRLGENKIGTTKRGIGPCYQDKAARKGIRIQDLLDEKIFRLKLETALAQKNPVLQKIYGLHTYTVDEICEEYLPYARILKPYMAETAQLLNEG
ncbi:MAG: adenylosuccinate synthetase, partial [Gordonibacter pamelaeae]